MASRSQVTACYNSGFVLEIILSTFAAIRVFFLSRSDMALEVLALRQQIAVLKRKRPRPSLNSGDRLFWTILRRFWSRWADVACMPILTVQFGLPVSYDIRSSRMLPVLAIPTTTIFDVTLSSSDFRSGIDYTQSVRHTMDLETFTCETPLDANSWLRPVSGPRPAA
jgi:hypothetical protein